MDGLCVWETQMSREGMCKDGFGRGVGEFRGGLIEKEKGKGLSFSWLGLGFSIDENKP